MIEKRNGERRNGGKAAVSSLSIPFLKKDFAVLSTKRAKRTHGDIFC
ncbi:MAG: hypothetical protein LBU22_04360 [Dysgonamonadaceae bacterium]|nr:hypothetical protein [Dysgonamonadaceae bacterium]